MASNRPTSHSLGEFLGRVDYLNRRPFFLARVVEVVLFGSMLKPEVDRVSDVDLAVRYRDMVHYLGMLLKKLKLVG